MARMIVHSRQPLDHAGDPRQGPQVGTESVRLSALAQDPIHALPLRAIDPWLSTGSTRTAKSVHASAFPKPIPSQDAGSTRVKSASHGTHDHTGGEQLGGLFSPTFEGFEISTRTQINSLHSRIVAWRERNVTLLCEPQ
jgi:hypothetical protein